MMVRADLRATGLIVAAVALSAASYAAGTLRAQLRASSAIVERAAASMTCASAGSVRLSDGQLAQLRGDLLRALAASSSAVSSRPPAEPPPVAVVQADDRQRAAIESAGRLVDDAIARGEWSDVDRATLRAQLVQLPGDARFELKVRFARAVNAGELHLHTSGAPL